MLLLAMENSVEIVEYTSAAAMREALVTAFKAGIPVETVDGVSTLLFPEGSGLTKTPAAPAAEPEKIGEPEPDPMIRTSDYRPADVRAWAKEQGLEVPERGRVPQDIVDLYNAAQDGLI